MLKKIGFLLIMTLIWIILFFNFSFFTWWNTKSILEDNEKTHNWKIISDILNENNYNKIWINPEEYVDFEEFLTDFKTFTWVLVDPISEKFVIWIKWDNDNIIFVPFDLKNSDNIFDDSENKNLAILDIFKSYKEWLLYWWIDSSYWNKILFEKDFQHPKTQILRDIFNVDINTQSNNVFNIIDSLEKSEEIWVWNSELLAYLNDFVWKYDNAWLVRNNTCEKYKSNCDKGIDINVTWNVIDTEWNKVEWVKIELLNNRSFAWKSNNEWEYEFNFNFSPFSHLRFKASKTWYSDGFGTVSINKINSEKTNIILDFKIENASNYVLINNETSKEYKKWRYYIIETDNSKYFIPINGLWYIDWRKYIKNNFKIYTYLFKKSSNMDNMLENDTFEPVYGYVWNIMKTFGMPYIQFVDVESGEELYIRSSDPMILQNQIYHMKELYENSDHIYEKVTDEDMEFLVQKSEELGWYPIDFKFLTDNWFLRWPAWWSLDRVTWVWSNVGSRVINVWWLVELPFYHINDN